MRVTEFYERWAGVVKQSVVLVSGGGGGMEGGRRGWDGGGELAKPSSRLFRTHVSDRAPGCHQHHPTRQPNDKDASPSGSVISGLTAPLFFPPFTPPPTHTHTHTMTVKGDGKRVKMGRSVEHKASLSITNGRNTKANPAAPVAAEVGDGTLEGWGGGVMRSVW